MQRYLQESQKAHTSVGLQIILLRTSKLQPSIINMIHINLQKEKINLHSIDTPLINYIIKRHLDIDDVEVLVSMSEIIKQAPLISQPHCWWKNIYKQT